MKRTMLLSLIACGLLLPIAGCKHCGSGADPQSGPCSAPGAPTPLPPGLLPGPMPKGPQWLPDAPPPGPIDSQSKTINPFEYQKDLAWKSGSGSGMEPAPSVRLYPPEVVENPDADQKAKLYPPDGSEVPKPLPSKVDGSAPAKEALGLPVGIGHFVQVRDKVANGLRPSLDDGLDWLQARGFKTVLFLHEAGVPDSADRKQVEKRGMKFVALEVSPVTLSQKMIDEFNRMVGDSAGLPLFVYDRDGSLAGGLWYLHFRLTGQVSEDVARNQARALGLREDGDGTHREMWLAAQKFLSEMQN